MTSINEQTSDYNLADLDPLLEKAQDSNTLLDSLPVWLSAQTLKSAGRGRSADNTLQYGVQKLRELILELAVCGKLVPQDPNDEPASVLLEKIAEEKARLISEGKIKKEKSQPDETTSELPYAPPIMWEWIKLGELVDVLDSLRKPITKSNRKDGPYPYYGASGIVDYVADFIFDEPLVLVGEDGAKWGRGDQTAFSISGKSWVNNHAHVLRTKDYAIEQAYLVYYLTASDLSEYITGMTVPKLNQKRLVSIPVPVPPLAEQHRIVKKVDELMALCDRLERQQTDAVQAHDTLVNVLLDTLTQSETAEDFQQNWQRLAAHFDTLFTTESSIDQLKQTLLQLAVMGKLVPQDPNDEPASVLLEKIAEEKARLISEGKIKKEKSQPDETTSELPYAPPIMWEWIKLGELVDVLDSLRKPITKSNRKDGPYPYYGASGIVDYVADFIFDEPLVLVGEDGAKWGRGDQTAFSISGKSWVNNHAHVLRTKDYAIEQAYLVYYLTASDLSEYITGMTVPKLNQKRLVSIPVPVPPLAEQHRIVKKVDELMALCDQLKDRLNQAQTLQQQLADAVVSVSVNHDCD